MSRVACRACRAVQASSRRLAGARARRVQTQSLNQAQSAHMEQVLNDVWIFNPAQSLSLPCPRQTLTLAPAGARTQLARHFSILAHILHLSLSIHFSSFPRLASPSRHGAHGFGPPRSPLVSFRITHPSPRGTIWDPGGLSVVRVVGVGFRL